MQVRRDKGLCFNCDEKFNTGHRCKSKFLLLLTEDDGDFPEHTPDGTSKEASVDSEDANPGQISLNASAGHYNPKTFRVTAQVAGSPIQVLIDSGSSYNFLQVKIAK